MKLRGGCSCGKVRYQLLAAPICVHCCHCCMSYDLYFTKPRITQEQFAAFFRGRRNYEVSDRQCVYENQDTGVYFIIDYNEQNGVDPEMIASTASLSLNYYRPHFFGLE